MVRGALKLFYNDHFSVPLPPKHRFPMPKYALVRKALQRELTPRGLASFHPSPLASLDELTACHTADYVDRYVNNKLSDLENRRVGFPWSQASLDRPQPQPRPRPPPQPQPQPSRSLSPPVLAGERRSLALLDGRHRRGHAGGLLDAGDAVRPPRRRHAPRLRRPRRGLLRLQR